MKRFSAGQKLETRSACDYNCKFTGTVVKRTAKTVTVNTAMRGETRCKIHTNDEGEFFFPFGRYRMAPIFRA